MLLPPKFCSQEFMLNIDSINLKMFCAVTMYLNLFFIDSHHVLKSYSFSRTGIYSLDNKCLILEILTRIIISNTWGMAQKLSKIYYATINSFGQIEVEIKYWLKAYNLYLNPIAYHKTNV